MAPKNTHWFLSHATHPKTLQHRIIKLYDGWALIINDFTGCVCFFLSLSSISALYISSASTEKPWLAFCKWPPFFLLSLGQNETEVSAFFKVLHHTEWADHEPKVGPVRKNGKNDSNDGAKLNLLRIWLYIFPVFIHPYRHHAERKTERHEIIGRVCICSVSRCWSEWKSLNRMTCVCVCAACNCSTRSTMDDSMFQFSRC